MRNKFAALSSLVLLWLVAGCGGGMDQSNDASASMEGPVGPPREGVYCEAVEQRVSPRDCEDLTRADAEVRTGEAAYNVPDPMRRGKPVEVYLVIDRRSPREIRVIEAGAPPNPGEALGNSNADDPAAGNSASAGDQGSQDDMAIQADEATAPTPSQVVEPLEGRTERFQLPAGRHMRAQLVGPGFDIVSKTDESQEIPLGGQATWIWSLTARKGGTQSLTLVTFVEGVADGRRFVLARTPKVRTVTVEVSVSDWLRDLLAEIPGWIKAITAVVVAIGGLLTAIYAVPWRRRRSAARDTAAAKPDPRDRSGGDGPEDAPSPGGEAGA